MKILVSGGAGYKGVVLVQKLVGAGHRVSILDSFMYGYDSVLHLVREPNIEIVKRDIRNLQRKDVAGFDVVYHLAGISGVPACAANPHAAETINVAATRLLVEMLDPQQLLIYASTTSFYGASGAAFDETMSVEPISLYGQTKYAAEQIVQQRQNSISLRFATVFGVSPRMRNDLLVNDFVYRAMKDRVIVLFGGTSKRTFIHILDAVNAYVFALDHADNMRGQVFNVGDPDLNFSKVDIATMVAKDVPCEIVNSSLPSEDKRNFLVSFDKIVKQGFKVRFGLEDGIRELVKLYGFYGFAEMKV
jgi:nucleoside-diphosphate-sugar epimerase